MKPKISGRIRFLCLVLFFALPLTSEAKANNLSCEIIFEAPTDPYAAFVPSASDNPYLAESELEKMAADPARYEWLKRARAGVYSDSPESGIQIPESQQAVIYAQERQRSLDWVEVADVEVVRLLPDNLRRDGHQKWEMALANGSRITAVYNLKEGKRVPVEVGDKVSLGGQYIWERDGGLIHWLHSDRSHRRPDGYVDHKDQRYGQDPSEVNR